MDQGDEKIKKHSPLLFKYLKKLREDPTSTVFAPLAETYRKAGLIDEALKVCQDGLKHHPHLPSGLVALARCYADLKKHENVIEVVRPVVDQYPDNLAARKLLAEALYLMSAHQEAVKEFEELSQRGALDEQNQRRYAELTRPPAPPPKADPSNEHQIAPPPPPVEKEAESFEVTDLKSLLKEEKPAEKVVVKFATHTMVDLYLKQGQKEKALAALQQLIKRHPSDKKAKQKLAALNGKTSQAIVDDLTQTSIDRKIQLLSTMLQNVRRMRQSR